VKEKEIKVKIGKTGKTGCHDEESQLTYPKGVWTVVEIHRGRISGRSTQVRIFEGDRLSGQESNGRLAMVESQRERSSVNLVV
jgi:hypothetical protein